MECVPNNSYDNVQDTSNAEEVILIDANEVDNNVDANEVVNDDDNNNTNIFFNNNTNADGIANGTNQVIVNNEEAEESADQSATEISVENKADEIIQPDQATEEAVCRTRSRRISKPCKFSRYFPETDHCQDAEEERKWINLIILMMLKWNRHGVMECITNRHVSVVIQM